MTVAFAIQQFGCFLLCLGRPKWCFYVEATFHKSITELSQHDWWRWRKILVELELGLLTFQEIRRSRSQSCLNSLGAHRCWNPGVVHVQNSVCVESVWPCFFQLQLRGKIAEVRSLDDLKYSDYTRLCGGSLLGWANTYCIYRANFEVTNIHFSGFVGHSGSGPYPYSITSEVQEANIGVFPHDVELS